MHELSVCDVFCGSCSCAVKLQGVEASRSCEGRLCESAVSRPFDVLWIQRLPDQHVLTGTAFLLIIHNLQRLEISLRKVLWNIDHAVGTRADVSSRRSAGIPGSQRETPTNIVEN